MQDEAFDREFAKLLAKRREAELDPENDYRWAPGHAGPEGADCQMRARWCCPFAGGQR